MDSIIRVGVCALKLPLAPPLLCTETASLSEHAFIHIVLICTRITCTDDADVDSVIGAQIKDILEPLVG